MNRNRLKLLAIGSALLPVVTGGCGFLFSHAPPEGHEQMDYFTCTEGDAGPIIDIVWAGLNVAGAAVIASDPDTYANADAAIVGGISWGVISGAAAVVGFNKSKKCRAAKRALAERQGQRPAVRREPQPADDVVQAVVINPAADTLGVGERVQLVASAYNSSGGMVPNKMFAWSSSNAAIASVNNAGLVTAHASGAVVIAANTDNVVGIANMVVASPR